MGEQATGKQGLRDRHKERTRTGLLEAAMRLFAERGYGQVTVDDVCAEADVSARTFFRYFRSKDALLGAAFLDLSEAVLASLTEQPAGQDAWQSMRAALLECCADVDAHSALFLQSYRVTNGAPDLFAASAGALIERERAVTEVLAARLTGRDRELRAQLLTGLGIVALRSAMEAWAGQDARRPLADVLPRYLRAVEQGPAELAR